MRLFTSLTPCVVSPFPKDRAVAYRVLSKSFAIWVAWLALMSSADAQSGNVASSNDARKRFLVFIFKLVLIFSLRLQR
jgi:hypothetical protein